MCSISLNNIQSIYYLRDIKRIFILVSKQEFFKFRILFTIKNWRIKIDLIPLFQQLNQKVTFHIQYVFSKNKHIC